MRVFFASVVLLFVLAGCWGKKTIPIAETSLPTKGKFETVWVNPRIVYSDTLSTLISAERLDSVFVRTSEHTLGDAMPTVTFEVTHPTCDAVASIVDGQGRQLTVLFHRTLIKALYKLTLNSDRFQAPATGTMPLRVRLALCGTVSTHTPSVASPAQ